MAFCWYHRFPFFVKTIFHQGRARGWRTDWPLFPFADEVPSMSGIGGDMHIPLDRRKQRTRQSALAAFSGLLFEQGYEAITLSAVAERAGLGRSTLYEHYRSKEALLEASVEGRLALLAARHPDPSALEGLLRHIREQAGSVRILLAQPLRSRIAQVLAARIAARLREEGLAPAWADLRALVAAEGMLAAIAHWMRSGWVIAPGEVAGELAALAAHASDTASR
jgi:AcrR family transcriptional regulator